jgi:hypothetical protein
MSDRCHGAPASCIGRLHPGSHALVAISPCISPLDELTLGTAGGTRTLLHDDLRRALARADVAAVDAVAERHPTSRLDGALTLALIHDLHLAPVMELGDAVWFQHHPAIAGLKGRLEAAVLEELVDADARIPWDLPADAVEAVRAVGARDQVPALYQWVAEQAGTGELLDYLALEGGPDGGFDDLVAIAQVGLDGEPKLELATNYWDEMGGGDPVRVHTELYRRFIRAVNLPMVPRHRQPVEAIERSLLGTVLATNRALQPELLGALGLIELQAGPRCRRVLSGLDRLGFADDARQFYEEHALTDPRHGKDWLDRVIAPLAEKPGWAAGIVRGARWRWTVNDRFFTSMADRYVHAPVRRAG